MEISEAVERGRNNPSIFAREILGVDLNPLQERWFTEVTKEGRKRCILVPSNQCGKTLASAILHIWHAFYKPRLRGTQDQRLTATYPTLNISPNSNQMRAMFKYMLEIVSGELLWTDPKTGETRTNDSKIKWFLKKQTDNPMPIIFWENGSITYGRSVHDDRGKGLAGGQYAYITYDECVLCYSEDTEVLTSDGWKYFNDVKVGDSVPSLNLETEKVEIATTKEVIWEKYQGDMVYFGNNEINCKTDFLVTPNHRMVVRKSKGANKYSNLQFVKAERLVGKHFKIPRGGKWYGNNVDVFTIPGVPNTRCKDPISVSMDTFMDFLGFYISEGCVDKNSVCLAQMPYTKGYIPMENMLKNLGLSYTKNRHGFRIFSKQLAEYIKKNIPGYSWQKRIPREFLDLRPSLLKRMFDSLMLGDGTGGRVYITSSKGLADDFMELSLKLGLVPTVKMSNFIGRKITIREDDARARHKIYVISLCEKADVSVNHHKDGSSSVTTVPYKGMIGCLRLDKNHTLMVRRNGRVMWSGNSHHLKDEVTGNIYSRLIKYNGDLHLIGTPNSESPSNQYYMHIVKKGLEEKEGWFAMRGKLDDNIFFTEKDRDEIKKNLRQMNPDQYRQVVFGDFVDAASGYFSPDQVDRLFRDDLTWQEFVPGHRYILSIDWAIAKNDYTVMMVIDFSKKPYRVVKINRFQGHEFKPQEQYAIARGLQREYEADFITDASGLGGAIIKEELADIVTQAFTFGGSGQNKQEMLLYLKEMLAAGDLICPFDPELAEELGTYKEDDKRLVQDMVMALGMASWYIKENYTDENKKGLLEINLFR